MITDDSNSRQIEMYDLRNAHTKSLRGERSRGEATSHLAELRLLRVLARTELTVWACAPSTCLSLGTPNSRRPQVHTSSATITATLNPAAIASTPGRCGIQKKRTGAWWLDAPGFAGAPVSPRVRRMAS
eukprot:TRINITY_DN25855_c0_g1_i2.p1 TRINITY_DN25855_c0_g1~~TRINITY_DN25855_c0_g1_i2.p1  ORF type:complete len:129 (-),score=16.13 TRINITY_DN25855_c0_g1_i2:28-414(-)